MNKLQTLDEKKVYANITFAGVNIINFITLFAGALLSMKTKNYSKEH